MIIPFDRKEYFSALKPAIGIGVLGLIIIQIGWGEITGLDVFGIIATILIVAYLIFLLRVIKEQG